MNKLTKKQIILIGFILILLFQLGVLGTQYVRSVYPLWVGQELKLETVPIDPRSKFRGQYVRLNYKVSLLSQDLFDENIQQFRSGERVYVSIEQRGESWQPTLVSRERPIAGTFLRGRVDGRFWQGGDLRVRYGIEAYFASPERARELERRNWQQEGNQPRYAKVKVSSNGQVALVGLAQ